jgi:hypothetical protein
VCVQNGCRTFEVTKIKLNYTDAEWLDEGSRSNSKILRRSRNVYRFTGKEAVEAEEKMKRKRRKKKKFRRTV